jgi:hypothetical protein
MFTKFVVMVATARRAAPRRGEPRAASIAPGSVLPDIAQSRAPSAMPRMLVRVSEANTARPLRLGDAL